MREEGRLARLRQARESRGAAMIEMAIALIILIPILLGILDLGRVFYNYEALANAAREGARYCALDTECDTVNAASGKTYVQERVEADLGGRVDIDGVVVEYPQGRKAQKPVVVTVDSTFQALTPVASLDALIDGLPPLGIVMHVSASMVVW